MILTNAMGLVELYTLVSSCHFFINIDIIIAGGADKALLITPASLSCIVIGFIINTIV